MLKLVVLCLAVFLFSCATIPQEQVADHSGHSAHLDNVEPDDSGRKLYGVKHNVDASMVAELRTKPVFQGYTDEQIVKVMGLMGSNYEWYSSDPALQGKVGVLILGHGFGEHGDTVFRQQLGPLAQQQPTTFAIGMSMMTSDHIQLGLNDLAAAGVQDVVVIPVVSTQNNSLMRQWNYIFANSDQAEYARVPQVATSAQLHFASPLEDHPLVGEILVDFAYQISESPESEEVIIVGHGPVDPDDNAEQLSMMENLADYIRADGDFAAVHVATLQDDAPREIRMARIQELRDMIVRANERGNDVLIVTNLLGTRIVQSSLRRGLRGLEYRFNTQGLIQHENFVEWVNLSVDDTLASIKP